MQDAEIMGEHYGRLYERYRHMEEKYKERCNENAQLALVSIIHDTTFAISLERPKTNDRDYVLKSADSMEIVGISL